MKTWKTISIIILLGFVVVVSGCVGQTQSTSNAIGTEKSLNQSVLDCKNYYWYDDTNKDCDQRQLCGAFMYLGLHVFDTKEECMIAVSEQKSQKEILEKTNFIDIEGFAFNKSPLTIKKGETVIWINKDSTPHTVTSDFGNELSSGTLNNGEEYSHTFNILGSYEYHCKFHPGMTGRIIVE